MAIDFTDVTMEKPIYRAPGLIFYSERIADHRVLIWDDNRTHIMFKDPYPYFLEVVVSLRYNRFAIYQRAHWNLDSARGEFAALRETVKKYLEPHERYAQNLKEVTYTEGLNKLYYDVWICLLYTSPSPRDRQKSRMPSSA